MRNETRTHRYLKNIFPKARIVRQYRINEKVYHKGVLIRHFVKPDFFIKTADKTYIVEYNGKQHYEPSRKYGKKAFEKQQIRDNWLKKYCKEKGIIFIEIDGRKYTRDKIKKYLDLKIKKPLGN